MSDPHGQEACGVPEMLAAMPAFGHIRPVRDSRIVAAFRMP
jgi:hypothetical protein